MSDPDPTDVKLTAEEIEQFRKLGIDPKFVGVTSEDEARKRIADVVRGLRGEPRR